MEDVENALCSRDYSVNICHLKMFYRWEYTFTAADNITFRYFWPSVLHLTDETLVNRSNPSTCMRKESQKEYNIYLL